MFYNIIVFLIFVVICSAVEEICGEPNLVRQKRIVGGNKVRINKYPWLVAILDSRQNNQLLCAGAVITKQHIITAAHCVFGRKSNEIAVKIGSIFLNNNKKIYNITSIECHEKFFPAVEDFDIAILTLKYVLNNTQTQPICLPQYSDYVNYKTNDSIIAGWGKTEFYGSEIFNEILETSLNIADKNECKIMLKKDRIEATDRILCAGDLLGTHDACQGDSGTPLMVVISNKYYAIGLSSFGIGCGQLNHYGVYTKLDYFIDWIVNKIKTENMKCQKIETTR